MNILDAFPMSKNYNNKMDKNCNNKMDKNCNNEMETLNLDFTQLIVYLVHTKTSYMRKLKFAHSRTL